MTFEGKYFVGGSTEGLKAKVAFKKSSVYITLFNNRSPSAIEWDIEKIHPNDLTGKGPVFLKFGNIPYQYLEIVDDHFPEALREQFPEAAFLKTTGRFAMSTTFAGLVSLSAAFIGLLLLIYFILLPLVAERIAANLPIKWEQELGNAVYRKMIRAEDVMAENTKRINRFFSRLHYQSNYAIEIYVVNDTVVNAFALPGGKIIVNQGILDAMNNSTQLAALLSHEFSHVQLKHTTKSMVRSLSGNLLLSLLLGDANAVTAIIVQNANQLKELSYSRSLEEEADKNGLLLMKQRNVDPGGMIALFETLKKEEGGARAMPQFLSTHPLTEERILYIQKEIRMDNRKWIVDKELDSLWNEIKTSAKQAI